MNKEFLSFFIYLVAFILLMIPLLFNAEYEDYGIPYGTYDYQNDY